jgi:hypothetical protein
MASVRATCFFAVAAVASGSTHASIVSSASRRCIVPSEEKAGDGTALKLGDCSRNEPLWGYDFPGRIFRRETPLCFDVPDNNRTSGQQLQLWKCSDVEQQKFIFSDGSIKTTDGSFCLDVRAEDNETVQLWECIDGAENQRWNLRKSSTNVSVASVTGPRCFDLAQGAESDGTMVQIGQCDAANPEATQVWQFKAGQLIHRSADGVELCLDIPGNNRTNGQQLQVLTCNGTEQQEFEFVNGSIRTGDWKMCVDLRMEDNQTLQLWTCMDSKNQLWNVRKADMPEPATKSQGLSIASATGAFCLDLAEESDGTPLQVGDCDAANPAASQVWQFKAGQLFHQTADGVNLCLDIPENKHTVGQQLQVWTCSGAEQQQFEFVNGTLRPSDGKTCVDLHMKENRSVQLDKCVGFETQRWRVQKVDLPEPANKSQIVSIASETGPI